MSRDRGTGVDPVGPEAQERLGGRAQPGQMHGFGPTGYAGDEATWGLYQSFDPETETWTPVAELQRDRTYHNSAVVLPDGLALMGELSDEAMANLPGMAAPEQVVDALAEMAGPPAPDVRRRPARVRLPAMVRADEEIERALVVGAHPDDIDFGCAGTVALWVRAGIEVTYLLITRGDQGGFDDTPRELVAGIRQAEQTAAAAVLGVTDVRFLDGYRDGWVEATPELVRDISRVIRQVRPQRMLIQSPERNYDRLPASHPDHLAAGEACIRAIYPAARNPFAFPELVGEGLAPWTVNEVFMMAHPGATHVVDVTDAFEAKIAALREHVSQTGHRAAELEERVRAWLADSAAAGGLGEGRLGELYHVILLE